VGTSDLLGKRLSPVTETQGRSLHRVCDIQRSLNSLLSGSKDVEMQLTLERSARIWRRTLGFEVEFGDCRSQKSERKLKWILGLPKAATAVAIGLGELE
jgi:hypothetical protein